MYFVQISDIRGINDNVQVTVYGSSNYCVTNFVTGEAGVYCFDEHGNPASTEFALLYIYHTTATDNVNHALAFTLAGGATGGTYPRGSYNSIGASVIASRNSRGSYTALFQGLTKPGGQVQVTPFLPNSGAARCTAANWSESASGTTVNIGCVDASGAPLDNGYLLAYSYGLPLGAYGQGGPHVGAYAFANQPTRTRRYYAGDHFQYNGFGTGPLAIQRKGTGLYAVTVPGTLTYAKSIAFVSAIGPAGTWCNVASLSGTTVNVACYAQGGVLTDSQFTVTFQTSAS